MYFNKAVLLTPVVVQGKTWPAGHTVCPVECLTSRQGTTEIEPFIADGNVWATAPKNVSELYQGINYTFVQRWKVLLLNMEITNPAIKTGGRPEMLEAIRLEALRRRSLQYHKEN